MVAPLLPLALLTSLIPTALGTPVSSTATAHHYDVLVLGGGVSGVIAARELDLAGVNNFAVVEARAELGGRMMSTKLNGVTLELGANWIEGLESEETGKVNPIWELAQKAKLDVVDNDWEDLTFYDHNGARPDKASDPFRKAYDLAYEQYVAMLEGAGKRIAERKVDLTARSGYLLTGDRFVSNPYDLASEYYNHDWEYAQSPAQSSWFALANNYNYSFDPLEGFGDGDKMCKDQRGFKTLIQQESETFLRSNQTLLSTTVTQIEYTSTGVVVHVVDGKGKKKSLSANHVMVSFSVGVLQNDDVVFKPALPDWKQEAIQAMKMATYTKIFLQFPSQFGFNETEMGLYADPHKRGYYPVWQTLDRPGFFPGKHLYFVTVTGDESERIETMSDAQIQSEVMSVLGKMYPSIQVPQPEAILLKRWGQDPLFRGSWSNWPSSFYQEHMNNLRATVNSRVHFIGEHTSAEYYGYLHGAYFEGYRRGRALAKCILKKKCGDLPGGGDFFSKNLEIPE